MNTPVGILLAAGLSTRFGKNKLLHPLDDHTPIVVQAARTLKAVLPQSIVVVGPDDTQTPELLGELGLEIVINPHPDAGMGSSLACAVRAAHDADGWLIALGDMPWINKQTIRQVASALEQPRDIVAPLYGDRRGHPVGFGKAYIRELLALEGDKGARHTLELHRQYLKLLPLEDPGVLQDVDRPEDIEAARGQLSRARLRPGT